MWRLISTVILFALTIMPAASQPKPGGEMRADFSLSAAIPQGELDDGIDGEAVGVSAFFGGPVPGGFLVLGSEFGLMNYGTQSLLSVHSTVFDDGIDDDLAIPLEAVNTRASNNIFMGHLVARLEPGAGVFRPYVDLLGGIKYFATRLTVESDVVVFRNGLDQDSYVTDFTFSYGVGGGIRLELYEYTSRWSHDATRVSLHAGVRYLFGTTGTYVPAGSLREEGNLLVVDQVTSRTDLIVPQFGISIRR